MWPDSEKNPSVIPRRCCRCAIPDSPVVPSSSAAVIPKAVFLVIPRIISCSDRSLEAPLWRPQSWCDKANPGDDDRTIPIKYDVCF